MPASKIVLPSANRCIYCDEKADLRLEHIIPLSLGGMIELPNASCLNCEKEINKFEQPISKESLVETRAVGGVKTRRPRDRPKTVPIKLIYKSGRSKKIDVDIEHAPIAFIVPFFALLPPRVGFPSELRSSLRFETCFLPNFKKNREKIIDRYQIQKTEHYTRRIQPRHFGRLLWKITLGALWTYAEKSVLSSNVRETVLTASGQYLAGSAPAVEVGFPAKFQFRNIYSEYSLGSGFITRT